MGIFRKALGIAFGVAGGPVGLTVFTVKHGPKAVEGTIDVARQIVKIGTDVYKAIPPEAFALGGFPVHGLLKHEFEDEIILLGHIAGNVAIFSGLFWPLTPLAIAEGAIPAYVAVGSLIGKIHTRTLNDQEWEMARYIFRNTLYDRSQITLTSLGGSEGRPFVFPTGPLGPVLVNLGKHYIHKATIDGPLLFHELTHVWQAKKRILTEIFLLDALNRKYDFQPGRLWSEYSLEQQASIVQAWTLGATSRINESYNKGTRNKLAIVSPLFRYINGNVRRFNERASTGNGGSIRQLLVEGGHRTIRDMHPKPPAIWWA